MSGRNDEGQAFPLTIRGGGLERGMSLRDWFAGLAMQGLVPTGVENDWSNQDLAVAAYRTADAMLAERAKDGEG